MDNDLTKEEKLLLEEYKIGWDVYYNSEKEYSNRENFFLAALTLIAGITIQLLLSSEKEFEKYFIILGIPFSLIWFFMQYRSAKFSKSRLKSLEEIENILNQSDTNENKNEFGFQKRINKCFDLIKIFGINNWTFRLLLPVLFFLFFMLMAIQFWNC